MKSVKPTLPAEPIPPEEATDASPTTISTTQSLDRALALLDLVVARSAAGASLPDIAADSGLSKATAHRLLTGLRNGGLVDYNPASRLFFPAFKLYHMGLAAGARFNVVQLAAPSMERLADETGDTIYLSVRSGDQAICVARRVGTFPIKTLTLEVGDSRPLGLGAGSLALLAALPDAEAEAAIQRNRVLLDRHPHFDPLSLRGYIARTRTEGHSINEGLMLPDMAAIGVGLRDPQGQVSASLSVAAIKTRMLPGRREGIVKLLQQEAATIETLLGLPPLATGTHA